jgi:hypothetical protein
MDTKCVDNSMGYEDGRIDSDRFAWSWNEVGLDGCGRANEARKAEGDTSRYGYLAEEVEPETIGVSSIVQSQGGMRND